MSKKTTDLSGQIDATYLEQSQIYSELLAMVIDQPRATILLRHLEANIVRRQNLQRELDNESSKSDNLFETFFGKR